MFPGNLPLLGLGVALAVGSQLAAMREVRRAYRERADPHHTDAPFALFVLRRRLPRETFTEAGWRHWQRAGWIAPAGWFVGSALVLASL